MRTSEDTDAAAETPSTLTTALVGSALAQHEETVAARLARVAEMIHGWEWRATDPDENPTTASRPAAAADPTHAVQHPRVRRRLVLLGAGGTALLALIIGLALPGSSPAPRVHHRAVATPPRHPSITAQYKAADQGWQSAEAALTTGLGQITGLPTVPAVAALITPYAAALERYQSELAVIHWPLAAQTAASSTNAGLGALATFLTTISALQPVDLGSWINNLHLHQTQVALAVAQLRSQIGLAP